MPIRIHVLVISSCLAAAAGQVFFKFGATGRSAPIEFANSWVAGGLVLYSCGTVIWVFALSKAPLTLVYPYTALTFVLVYLSGALLFREIVPARAIAGIGLVLLGLALISLVRTSR